MKALFQILMALGVVGIGMDLLPSGKETAHSQIEGQLMDVISRTPVTGVQIKITDSEGIVRTAKADEQGRFFLQVPVTENHNYTIKIQDSRYKIVNPSKRIQRYPDQQTWYLLPVGNE